MNNIFILSVVFSALMTFPGLSFCQSDDLCLFLSELSPQEQSQFYDTARERFVNTLFKMDNQEAIQKVLRKLYHTKDSVMKLYQLPNQLRFYFRDISQETLDELHTHIHKLEQVAGCYYKNPALNFEGSMHLQVCSYRNKTTHDQTTETSTQADETKSSNIGFLLTSKENAYAKIWFLKDYLPASFITWLPGLSIEESQRKYHTKETSEINQDILQLEYFITSVQQLHDYECWYDSVLTPCLASSYITSLELNTAENNTTRGMTYMHFTNYVDNRPVKEEVNAVIWLNPTNTHVDFSTLNWRWDHIDSVQLRLIAPAEENLLGLALAAQIRTLQPHTSLLEVINKFEVLDTLQLYRNQDVQDTTMEQKKAKSSFLHSYTLESLNHNECKRP